MHKFLMTITACLMFIPAPALAGHEGVLMLHDTFSSNSSNRIAENMACFGADYDTTYHDVAGTFVGMWLNSPGHRGNLLHDSALELGCGSCFDGKDIIKAVQNFQFCHPAEGDR